jgi:hypothetical protein
MRIWETLRKKGQLRRIFFRGLPVLLAGSTIWATGCTRSFFRKQADEEVSEVLAQKDKYGDWRIEQFHVYPDPRARFADSTDPDHPPMPPDDPAAWDQSPHPQKPGKPGVARVGGTGYLDLLAAWDGENRSKLPAQGAPTEEKILEGEGGAQPGKRKESSYTSTILVTEPKPGAPRPYLLNLEQACELALINSREHQDERENLYLAALPVTAERFSFAAQFFAAGEAVRQWAGSQTPGGSQNNWALNSNAGFSKLFSTGALLLFNFANQTVFNLGGAAHPVTSQSTINLDLIQPLLQGAGPAVTLEPLTQAERNLMYEIRNYARFRKELYVAIAGGGGGSITGSSFQPTGVIAANTFGAGAGLGGSGLVPGFIPTPPINGNPGLQVSPGQSGSLSLSTALAAPVSGYLSTLLQAAQIQVDRYNIEKLEGFFKLAKALQEGGDISQLQTDTFEQQLLRGRQSLLTDQQNYLQAIDQFKLQLGVPTDLQLELDDTPFRPLNRHFRKYEDLFHAFKTASDEPFKFKGPEMVGRVRQELRRTLTTTEIVKDTNFSKRIEAAWTAWARLSSDDLRKRQSTYRAEHRQLLDKQTDLETKGQILSAAEQQRLEDLANDIDVGDFESVLREYEAQPWNRLLDPALKRRQQQEHYGYVVNAFIVVITQARNERMKQLHDQWPILSRACVNGVDLLKADLDDAEGVAAQYALIHRLDLMNVRAQVVDSWRQLAVFANALLMPLNVQYALTSSTPALAATPLAFSGSRTQQQIILNTQLPLVRVTQRNNYRASLIGYQRARRILQRAEDAVAYDVRQELILLRQLLENYRIQTRQVELAYMTVENALDTLQAPPTPVPAGQAGLDVATRAASLTSQLINAQSGLYNAHFTMTTIWINYLNTRDQLYRDLELMPLDGRGVWQDDVETCQCSASDSRRPGGSESDRLGATVANGQRQEREPAQRLPEPAPQPAAGGAPGQPGR